MKLSRTTIIALASALSAFVLAAVIFNRPAGDKDDGIGEGQAGDSRTGPAAPVLPSPPTKTPRTTIVDPKPMAAKELDLLWARGRGQELLIELDRLSASKDPEHWREVGPVLIKHAAKEGRPEIAQYLLATGDAAPDQIRIQIYAAALDNRDKEIESSARLELENITGEEFENGEAAREWLAANPQTDEDGEEMIEDQ